MAAQIADRSNTGMNFSSGSNDEEPVVSNLEATRLALAQEQKKRIDAAVARVTSKKESGKRKGLGERPDAGHCSKKNKTVVDVVNGRIDKTNSMARRMVDRFATMPEPEKEGVIEQKQEPITRSVSTQQFVARSTSVTTASSLDTVLRKTREKVTTTKTTATILVESPIELEEVENVASDDEEEEREGEQKSKLSEWDGPTTNFHVKQLGLDSNVDIYAPIAQQEHDVQRVRERIKYMPIGDSSPSLNTSSDSVMNSEFLPNDVLSQESEKSDALFLPEVSDSEIHDLAEEVKACEQQAAVQTDEVHQPWAKRVFIYTPLFIVAMVVLLLALLFAIDWSQETFQFCGMNGVSTEDSEEVFSCASFVETQSLIKATLQETADKMQKKVQSYLE